MAANFAARRACRYIPALQGVVLAHDRLAFLDRVATVKADCTFANCRVAFDATVWSPSVGMKLGASVFWLAGALRCSRACIVGRVNLCSPDHVALLVHRTFNVSIPSYHIPDDSWEFEYGPAENDPEFGAGAGEGEIEPQHEDLGRWVHKVTGTKMGGEEDVELPISLEIYAT